jgi:hypothetical protein
LPKAPAISVRSITCAPFGTQSSPSGGAASLSRTRPTNQKVRRSREHFVACVGADHLEWALLCKHGASPHCSGARNRRSRFRLNSVTSFSLAILAVIDALSTSGIHLKAAMMRPVRVFPFGPILLQKSASWSPGAAAGRFPGTAEVLDVRPSALGPAKSDRGRR